jgi:hypothetical protein
MVIVALLANLTGVLLGLEYTLLGKNVTVNVVLEFAAAVAGKEIPEMVKSAASVPEGVMLLTVRVEDPVFSIVKDFTDT